MYAHCRGIGDYDIILLRLTTIQSRITVNVITVNVRGAQHDDCHDNPVGLDLQRRANGIFASWYYHEVRQFLTGAQLPCAASKLLQKRRRRAGCLETYVAPNDGRADCQCWQDARKHVKLAG